MKNKSFYVLPPIACFMLVYWTWGAVAVRVLSFFNALNLVGILISAIPLCIVLYFALRSSFRTYGFRIKWRRYFRGLPAFFAVLTLLLCIGSIMSGWPRQADYLEYRLCKMMHWIMEETIHFISPWNDIRVNNRAAAQEFAAVPFIIMFKKDWIVMVFNLLMFVTMPGLTFKLLRYLRVSPSVSYILMWGIPTCIAATITQAGGAGNDLAGIWFAIILLISFFQLKTGKIWIVLLQIASSAAIFSNTKSSNALLLPFFAVPILYYMIKRKSELKVLHLVLACVVFLLSSVLPLMYSNYKNVGTVTGERKVALDGTAIIHMPVHGRLIIDGILTFCDLVQPPILPGANQVGQKVYNVPIFKKAVDKYRNPDTAVKFSPFLFLQTEENAGIGIFYSLLLVFSVLGGVFRRKKARADNTAYMAKFLVIASILSLIMFMSAFCAGGIIRVVIPYFYIILVGLVAIYAPRWTIAYRKFIKSFVYLVLLSAMVIAIFVPTRQLIPPSLFIKLSSLASSSMKDKAIITAKTYQNRGIEYKGLVPDSYRGDVAFLLNENVHSAYWRCSTDSKLDPGKNRPVWYKADMPITEADAIILSTWDIQMLGFDSIDTFCDTFRYRIVSHKQSVFKISKGYVDLWFIERVKQ